MTAPRVAIVGAGVAGLACALRLADDGWRVTVHDDSPPANASGIAAGMLAPASEALLDGAGPYDMLRHARDLWPDLGARIGEAPSRDGALHLVEADELQARAEALEALGATARVLRGAALADAWPTGLGSSPAAAVFTPDDWRLSAGRALAALRAHALAAGAEVRPGRLDPFAATPAALGVDAVVIAAGWGAAAFAALAPEAAALSPVKGQLLRFASPPWMGPTIRAPGAYLSPDAGGAILGATMETGRADTRPDPAQMQALRRVGFALAPDLAHAPARTGVGVRAATPDGRPLVGPSATPGVWWASGMRRNGWLLAPLVAQVLAAYLSGRDPGAWAPSLHPRRFGPARAGTTAAHEPHRPV